PERRVAFAATCAERLAPTYATYSARTGRGDPAKLESLLDRLWADLAGDHMTEGDVQASIDASMELLPQEEDGPWVFEAGPAEDAAAALAYALQCRQNGESKKAALAARHMYDTLDEFIINRYHQSVGEGYVRTYAVVQAELARVLADPLVQ